METLREIRLPATGMIGFDATLRRMASDREAVKLGLVHLGQSLVWITVSLVVIDSALEEDLMLEVFRAIALFVNSDASDGREALLTLTLFEATVVAVMMCGLVCSVAWVLVTQTMTSIMKTIFCAYRGYELAERKVSR